MKKFFLDWYEFTVDILCGIFSLLLSPLGLYVTTKESEKIRRELSKSQKDLIQAYERHEKALKDLVVSLKTQVALYETSKQLYQSQAQHSTKLITLLKAELFLHKHSKEPAVNQNLHSDSKSNLDIPSCEREFDSKGRLVSVICDDDPTHPDSWKAKFDSHGNRVVIHGDESDPKS